MSEATNRRRCPFSRAFLRVFPPTSMQGAWELGPVRPVILETPSQLALEASGLNTGLRYKVCASSLDHNGQERAKKMGQQKGVKCQGVMVCAVLLWWSDLKVSNFVRWTWMEQAQLCTTWKRLNVESWWLWGAKPAGYSLFDIYVSGVVSASCLGIWRNFHFVANRKPSGHIFWAMPAI